MIIAAEQDFELQFIHQDGVKRHPEGLIKAGLAVGSNFQQHKIS